MRRIVANGVRIDDTFAEAFGMRATALLITAPTMKWARQAAVTMTGFATSVIACGCEAGIDREVAPSDTPDGGPGSPVAIRRCWGSSKVWASAGTPVGGCRPAAISRA